MIVALLIIVIFEFNKVQNKLVELSSQTQETSKMANSIQSENEHEFLGLSRNRKWLHPNKPNLIINKLQFIAPKDANYETELNVRASTEEKSYNRIIDNSTQLMEYFSYIGCAFASRSYDNIDDFIGELAERVELINDDKDFVIYIKKGVKWHKPVVDLSDPKYAWLNKDHYVTAHDVKFTLNTIKNTQVETALRGYYKDLDSVEIIDDYTVIIKWKKKLFINKDVTLGFPLMPEFIYAYDESGVKFPEETFGLNFNNHWYNDRMIGCGPYMWKEHVNRVHILLERNEDYFIGAKPIPKTIKYLLVKDHNLALLKLKAGDIDILDFINRNVYRDEILNGGPNSPFLNGELKYKKYPTTGYGYIGWNNADPIFKDKMVRRAMTHAFNKEKYLNTVWAGLGEPVVSPVSPFSPEYDHEIKPYAYNLDKASKILKKAGWKDANGDGILEKKINGEIVPFEFSLLCFDYPQFKILYSMYKEDLRKIGIKMNLNLVDWAILQRKMDDKDFSALNGGWSSGMPLDFYQIWHSSQANKPGGNNFISFRNKRADYLIEKFREVFNGKERIKIAHEIQRIIHEEQPYTFRWSSILVAGFKPYVKNVTTTILRPHLPYQLIYKTK